MSARLVGEGEIRRVVVLGAGTMGHGIAHVCAAAGWETWLQDLDLPRVQAGLDRVRENLEQGVSRGQVTPEARDATLARLKPVLSVEEAVADAELVIEAVLEKLDLKQELFARIDRHAPPRALLATNTSSLSIAAIAGATRRPERVVGLHFFNPVHIMKLLEIVRHEGTSDEAVALGQAVARRIGKTPIVARDVPGFASSRLGVALGLEAIRMVEAGVASPADIDTAMTLGYGHPMGPLELGDLVGLDVRLHIAEYLAQELGPAFTPPALLRRMVEEGKLGRKSGQGFYRWEAGKAVK